MNLRHQPPQKLILPLQAQEVPDFEFERSELIRLYKIFCFSEKNLVTVVYFSRFLLAIQLRYGRTKKIISV